jgi:2-oxoglutarate dehydrogenase E1 component
MTAPQAGQSINAWNAEYIDAMYQRFREDPGSVDETWRTFFRGYELGAQGRPGPAGTELTRQGRVDALIDHYRDIGHFAADLDPLAVERPVPDHLRLEAFELTETDLDAAVDPGTLPLPRPSPLRDVVGVLRETYCGHIGVEYMHIQERAERRWLQERMEPIRNRPEFTPARRRRILRELAEAEGLEDFLSLRYRGKKRFSLEGAESLNALLNELVEHCPEMGIRELTIGMAHRGRLNVLVNILNKSYDQLFTEFEEAWVEDFTEGGGDVKYHRGYSAEKVTESGQEVRLTLSPNPSHLEHVNPVVLGRARAKQRLRGDTRREQCVPILIHGDASFPGQGIVAETFNLTRLDGYTVGGAVHIIINNQIGFTTNPVDAHSGRYCTDIAKMVEAPIFHVNGDDPEACVLVGLLALEYRQRFKKDAVIDVWCYRRHGHNESDEPSFTQPLMYQRIADAEPVTRRYARHLVEAGVITEAEVAGMMERMRADMDQAQSRSRTQPVAGTVSAFRNVWSGLTEKYSDDPVETGASREHLARVARALGTAPEGFALHPRLAKLMAYRREAVEKDLPLDWGMGELLAYGTLLLDRHPVRLTGQDVERGTFSHRHAVLVDQRTGQPWEPLNSIDPAQARCCIHNSPLTENACLAFEYGYSLGDPRMMVIWEAQFGDFANGAQVIFDQFIASAETKWRRCTGLTVFLPHGYEGAGPEHSSARLERFLALCANNNLQVVYPTTPAQHFHLLRRQMKRSFRKPLIVMTPKSLLRNPAAVSSTEELLSGHFHQVLDDPGVTDPGRIERLLLCSGKIYYDLVQHRQRAGRDNVAVARVEQLYPLRVPAIHQLLRRYQGAEVVWVQEEPMNMGAWRYMEDRVRELFGLILSYVGRPENSTPAVASERTHREEQQRILVEAVGPAREGVGAASGESGEQAA